jgi:AsmA protein
MKKVLKWGAIICVSFAVVIIAALLIIPLFVDAKKYKPELEKYVSETTQRSFSVGDDVGFSLFPWASLSFSDLKLGNPSGFKETEFVSIKSFEIRIKLLPLLFSYLKDIEISRLILNEPRIALVKTQKELVNWEFPSSGTDSDKETEGKPSGTGLPISRLVVNDFAIKNGVVLWMDHSTNTRKEVSAINLTVKDVSMERPVKLSFSALLDNQPISIDGSVGPVGSALQGGIVSLDLTVAVLKELSIKLKGNVKNAIASPAVDMGIDVADFSPRKLLAALEQPFPIETADPKTLTRVALKARVKATSESVSISDAILNLDESKLDFSMKASEFSKPNLTFDLNLDQIDLDRYMPPASEKKESAPAATAKKSEKIDYRPLRKLVMDGQLKVGNLIVSNAKIQDLVLKVAAKNGIINLNPMSLKMYSGNAAGNAALNVQTDTPKTSLNLNVKDIQVNPLLQDVAGKDILEGTTNARLSLSMVGDNAALIKKSLNGSGKLVFNDGAIKGIDLAAMVRNVKVAFGLAEKSAQRPKTDFAELSAPFTIKNGLVNTPQTSLKSPLLRVIASGNADLVNETLDLRVQPKIVGTVKGQGDETQRSGIMVPVVVSGTFAAPKFRPDLKSAATQELRQKVLESDKVKEALDKEDMKPIKEKTKGLLKGLLGE